VLLALATALALAAPRAPAFVAVVDPGHGGEHDGAIAPSGAKEKDLALAIARKVAARLRRQGGEAILTRTGDISVKLDDRAALAIARNADLFVSIHLNSMPTRNQRARAQGVEIYFLSADASDASAKAVAARENADRLAGEPEPDPDDPVAGIFKDLQSTEALELSSRLAYAIHDRLVAATGAEDRGVRQAPFYVLAGASMPAVLVEVGFLSHPQESRRLESAAYQDKVAKAIAEAVSAWRANGRHAMR
jgi:N-acetylmuramoyl-L-alanine amidase